MRRLLLLLLLASPAMAQRIVIITGGTVTANVTDSADFYVTLNQNVTGVTLTSTVTPATGYIVSMKFVQDATGSRTVTFGGTISTSCSVNSTALSVTICRWQYTASTNLWTDAAGGGVSPVTSLPATCTPGVTAPVNLTVNGTGYGVFFCSATNVWTPSNPTNTVSALAYGVLADTHVLTSTTVSWTGATSTATVTATSSVFLPTDCAVGGSGCTGTTSKIMFGTTGCCGGVAGDVNGAVTLPQGTISAYTSPTVVTVSFTGTSTACNTTACIFVWGSDDTTALASAYTALLGLGKDCGTLLLPAGKMLIQSAEFVTAPTCTGTSGTIANTIGASETIQGFGMNSTLLIPTPNFNFASCANDCFGGWRFAVFKDWSIWGAANALSGSNNAKNIVELSIESYAENFGIVAWGAADTSLVGLLVTNSRVTNSIFRGAGQKGCNIGAGGTTWFVNTVCTYNQNIALANASGAPFNSTNGFYGITNGATSSIQMSGNAWFNNDVMSGNAGSANTTLVVLGGNSYFNGVTSTASIAAANALALNGGNAYAINSTFGGGSSNSVNRIANTYFDLGGNTYSTAAVGIAPTCAMTTGGGAGPACALVAGSTNEKGTVRMTPGAGPAATGTTTITFAGTFAGASNTTPDCNFSYANTGSGAWSLTTTTPIIMTTRSTTVPVFNWNQTAALTGSSTYDVDYTCVAR